MQLSGTFAVAAPYTSSSLPGRGYRGQQLGTSPFHSLEPDPQGPVAFPGGSGQGADVLGTGHRYQGPL